MNKNKLNKKNQVNEMKNRLQNIIRPESFLKHQRF